MRRCKKVRPEAKSRNPRSRQLSSIERADRLELLTHAEAILVDALSHVMRAIWGGDLNWPGLIARPNGTRVPVMDEATDLVVDRLADVCRQVEAEIAQLANLPAGATRKRYKLTGPHPRERAEPQEKLHADAKSAVGSAAKHGIARNPPIVGSSAPCSSKMEQRP
jgi:hypothetical protein